MIAENRGAPSQYAGYSVLFVDDEAMALDAFDMACGGYFPVLTASSAAEAVERLECQAGQIAVIVSDQRMPRASGVDLLKEARQRYPHIVRLLTTAYADHGDTIAALNEAEVFRYIAKPWDVAALRRVLASAMEHFFVRRREQEMLQGQSSVQSTMAGQIAHELRGSFATIGSGIEGIRRYLPSLLQAYDLANAAGIPGLPVLRGAHRHALSGVLERMDRQVREAGILLEFILAQARADLSDAIQFGEHSMAECVEQALERFPFSEAQQRLVVADLHDDFVFFGAAPFVIHLLFNLLRNALYALKLAEKGRIDIRLERGAAWNRLYFRDGGTGIAPDVLPHIFQEFYSTRHAVGGNGIGLSFCRKVAEAMGGIIECRSSEGVFTEFVLSLPAP